MLVSIPDLCLLTYFSSGFSLLANAPIYGFLGPKLQYFLKVKEDFS